EAPRHAGLRAARAGDARRPADGARSARPGAGRVRGLAPPRTEPLQRASRGRPGRRAGGGRCQGEAVLRTARRAGRPGGHRATRAHQRPGVPGEIGRISRPCRTEHLSPKKATSRSGGKAVPATPWRSLRAADPGRDYLVLLSFLPLKRLWRIPWFALQANRIVRQLEGSAGVIGYSLNSRLISGQFWTLSVWDNEATLQAFVYEAPHVDTMRTMIPHMGPTRFVRWSVRGAELPVSWKDALRR